MMVQSERVQLFARTPAGLPVAQTWDPAARQVTIEWVRRKRVLRRYRFFMFLNSSVRGPFYPSYQPQGWAWTRAFTDRLSADVKVVASSIVCLPEVDAGGFGPKARRASAVCLQGTSN